MILEKTKEILLKNQEVNIKVTEMVYKRKP